MNQVCHFDAENSVVPCLGMQRCLDATKGTFGLHVIATINVNTPATDPIKVRKAFITFGKRDARKVADSLMLNWCPWCGQRVRDDASQVPYAVRVDPL